MLQRWRLYACQRRLFCKQSLSKNMQLAAAIWTALTAAQHNLTTKALVHE